MNIRQLKQFVSIAETGSISRSAKEQNISQPALTRSVKNLEEDLGVELIERRSNGVFLTDFGHHLLEYARCIVNDSERVRREILAMKAGVRGTISIGVGPSFSTRFLSATLERLFKRGADLEVHLVEGFVEDLCGELRNGSLDAVLSLFPESFDSSDLAFTKLCDVESVLSAGSNHRLAHSTNVTRAQLAQCNWVLADQKYVASAFREFLGGTLKPSHVHHIRANSIRLIKNLVLESDYLTIVPKILIEHELETEELVVIDGPVKPLVSVGGIATRKTGFRPEGLVDLIRIIKDEFSLTPDTLAFHKYELG
ncbi:MAG: LysR family transcriptional regulator [Woeseiaceae bacterium]